MFVFVVSVLLYLYLSVSLFACLYITILSVLPAWRINFIIMLHLCLLCGIVQHAPGPDCVLDILSNVEGAYKR